MGFQNFFATKLYTDIGAADNVITLETPPTVTSGRLVLEARNPTQREIISYTGVSGNQITGVTRGVGGTTAKSHLKNSLVEMNATAEDLQDLYNAFNSFAATNNDWRSLVGSFTFASSNGNGEYVLNTPSDFSSILYPGMRFKGNRASAPPTQMADFESSSSQYASRLAASVAGHSFTDDFTAEIWIEPESYGTSDVGFMSRMDGTGGWWFGMNSMGQVIISGSGGGSAGNFRRLMSQQSIALNKRQHIAAELDMSNATGAIYIDGVSVPLAYVTNGTAPTSLTQTGNLQIGAITGASQFDGRLSDARLWTGLRTALQINSNKDKQLVGNEAGLVGYWPLAGNFNDLTANANHLTSFGGAIATYAGHPFNTTEMGIITKVTPTQITVFAGTDFHFPNAPMNSFAYSTVRTPYGFPADENKWSVEVLAYVDRTQSIGALNQWYEAEHLNLSIPIGAWTVYKKVVFSLIGTIATGMYLKSTVATAGSGTSLTDNLPELMSRVNSPNATEVHLDSQRSTPLTLTTQTVYKHFHYAESAGGAVTVRYFGTAIAGYNKLVAKCAYL